MPDQNSLIDYEFYFSIPIIIHTFRHCDFFVKTTNKSILHVLYLLIMNNSALIIAMNVINNESHDVIYTTKSSVILGVVCLYIAYA